VVAGFIIVNLETGDHGCHLEMSNCSYCACPSTCALQNVITSWMRRILSVARGRAPSRRIRSRCCRELLWLLGALRYRWGHRLVFGSGE